MSIDRYKKIVSSITLMVFVFSTIIGPTAIVYAEDIDTGSQEATTNKAAYTTNNPAYTFNIQNISNVLPAVIGCTGIVNKVKQYMTSAFDGNSGGISNDLTSSKTGTGNYKAGYDDGSGNTDIDGFNAGIVTESVPTGDASTQKNTQKSAAEEAKIAEEEKQKRIKDECLNGVAYALAKAQLASITNKTVNWINSGFNGDPLFIRDRESYFKSLGDQTLQSLLGPLANINNQSLYPFGQDFARSAILSAKTTFLDRSKSTLSQSLKPGATTEDFSKDFSQGGWDGWFSLTQNPQNNPLGFGIIASQELTNKINAKQQEAEADLAQGDGFLSQKRCVEYSKSDEGLDNTTTSSSKNYSIVSNDTNAKLTGFYITTNSVNMAIKYQAGELGTLTASIKNSAGISKGAQIVGKTKKGNNDLGTTFNSLSASSKYEVKFTYLADTGSTGEKTILTLNITTPDKATGNQDTNRPTNTSTNTNATPECIRWETVTPGTVIADQLKINLGSSVRQLELADSLNESLSAIFEALVNQLVNQGLSSLSNIKNTSTNGLGGAGNNKVYDSSGIDISGISAEGILGNKLSVNKGSGWYNTNDTFDITKDLGDIYKLEKGKKVLVKKGIITIQSEYITAVKASMKEAPPIIPALGELDYCIPGPNPNWKSIAVPNVNETMAILRDIDKNGVTTIDTSNPRMEAIYSFMREYNPGFKLGENIGNIFTAKRKAGEAQQLNSAIDESYYVGKLLLKFNIQLIGDQYKSYRDKMDQLYGPNSSMRDPTSAWYLPMAEAGLGLTKNLISYDQSMGGLLDDYTDQINQTNANIYKLQQIKKKVDAIVAAAKKRQAADIRSGKIQFCAEEAGGPIDTGVTNGGLLNNTSSGTKLNPNNNGAVSGIEPIPDFNLSITESLEDCTAKIIAKNTSINTVGPYTWNRVTTDKNQSQYNATSKDFEFNVSTFSASGQAKVTLTISDTLGKPISKSKNITVPKRTKTLSGQACPI